MYSIFIYVHHPPRGCQEHKTFTRILTIATHVPAAARGRRRDLSAKNQSGAFTSGASVDSSGHTGRLTCSQQ
jgi:hypothetical protein